MSFARGVGESRIRRAAGWTGLVLLGVLQFGHPAGAQGTSSAASARAAVEKALRGGRYDEVETLGKSSTDQAITVMRAQALIARGEYASAEPLLTPLASRRTQRRRRARTRPAAVVCRTPQRSAPHDEAAVDGRSARSQRPRVTRARPGRRARSGASKTRNSFYREAIAIAPNDAAINTAWGDLFLEKHNRADAAKSYQAALKAEPDYAPAQLGPGAGARRRESAGGDDVTCAARWN